MFEPFSHCLLDYFYSPALLIEVYLGASFTNDSNTISFPQFPKNFTKKPLHYREGVNFQKLQKAPGSRAVLSIDNDDVKLL